STLLISSTASVTIMSDPPPPPYFSGTWIPIIPSSKYFGISSGSIFPARSMAATRGRISPSTNDATASRNALSSSLRTLSGAWMFAGTSENPRLELLRRRPEQVALGKIRSRGEQGIPFPRSFHSPCDQWHLERCEHRVYRTHGALAVWILLDAGERAPVELGEIGRELVEDLEAGSPGSHVVDRDPEAGATQVAQRGRERAELLARHALAHVEHHAVRDRLERSARSGEQRFLPVERMHVHEQQRAFGHVAAVLPDALVDRARQGGAPAHPLRRVEQRAVRREERLVAAHQRFVSEHALPLHRNHRLELGGSSRRCA